MYGLIHRAIRDFYVETRSDDAWARFSEEHPVDPDIFEAMHAYDDSVSYGLVGAASASLGMAVSDFLQEFGHFWVLHTGRKHYGVIMELGGSNFREFVTNLDAMHEQIAMSFTDLKQPSFRVENERSDGLVLAYHSDRPGLAPFVVGLLAGLGRYFEESVSVEQIRSKGDGAESDAFLVKGLRSD